jgi:tetratricopeptide (TPR) repeat protein
MDIDIHRLEGFIPGIAKYLFGLSKTVYDEYKASSWVDRAYQYQEKKSYDFAIYCLDKFLESVSFPPSDLRIVKGDLLFGKGMEFYDRDINGQEIFKSAINEFVDVIKGNPLNSVAWLGKGASHMMIGLQYKDEEHEESFQYLEAIFSFASGLDAMEASSDENGELKRNLLNLKGGTHFLIGESEEGNKCFKESDETRTLHV